MKSHWTRTEAYERGWYSAQAWARRSKCLLRQYIPAAREAIPYGDYDIRELFRAGWVAYRSPR